MKKIISLILIAILCLSFVSCHLLPGNNGSEEPVGPTLAEAVDFLDGIYKDKNEITRADYDVVAKVIIDGVTFNVTWTSDNASISIRESTKLGFYTVDLPDANEVEFSYTLTATIADAAGNTSSKSYTFKVPVLNNTGITSTPVEGVAYKLFLVQANLGKRYYALSTTQDNANKFINTTEDPKAGAEFYVEVVDGGYKVYTLVNGVKNYIFAKVERTENDDGTVKYSKYIGFSTEDASVLSYNANMGGTWTVSVLDLVWGIGTYNSFSTISISEGTYFTPEKVGSSQFVMQFMNAEYANTLESDKVESSSDAKEILDKLYALADGESATGSFTITGKITALDSYGNPTIVVEGYENQPVYCYRLTDSRFVEGATITVTAAQMKNYGGTYEFMSCTLDNITVPGGNTPSVGDNAVLDLMGNANLVSASGEQNVFAANGITFTNDKASSTSALTVQESYAQRAYANSTIKIEYPGMTKIVITFDDYSPDGTKNYMSGMDGMVVEGATFSRNNDVLTIIFAAPTDVFQSTNLTAQVRIEKIEVYTGDVENGGNEGGENGGNEGGETPAIGVVDAPVAGTAYKFGMIQGNVSSSAVYYLAGGMNGYYFATTTDENAAIDLYLEETTGGYYLYTLNADGSKLYVNMVVTTGSDGKTHVNGAYEATASTIYTYNTESKTIVASIVVDNAEAADYWFGTRNDKTYTTVGPCAVSLAGFYCQFYAASEGGNSGEVTPPAGGDNEGGENGGNTETPDLPAADSTLSIEEALELGGKYASATDYTGKYTTDKYYVTGTIESIANASKGNFYIVDENGNKLYVYGSYSADGSVGYDSLENKPVVGDVVTVYGVIGAYGPTIQLNNGWITAVTAHEHNYADATCTTKKTCTICNGTVGEILGHNAGSDGICTVCGENLNATIVDETFNIAASAGTLASDSLSISWASDHFNFVGKKANSTTAIRTSDSDHFRVYQGSEFSISGKNGEKITKVVITVTASNYASILADSLATNGVTATVDGTVVTLTIDGGSIDAIEFSATAQFRVKSFVISYK